MGIRRGSSPIPSDNALPTRPPISRYRDAGPPPPQPPIPPAAMMELPPPPTNQAQGEDDRAWDPRPRYPQQDGDVGALRGVLSRFSEGRRSHDTESDRGIGQDDDEDDDDRSQYSDSGDRQTFYLPEEDEYEPPHRQPEHGRRFVDAHHEEEDESDPRLSRFTTHSVYSLMDQEKSGAARQQFVNRVQALYGPDGREKEVVPPVPQLPEGLRGRVVAKGLAKVGGGERW
jgi:hypothetical protein